MLLGCGSFQSDALLTERKHPMQRYRVTGDLPTGPSMRNRMAIVSNFDFHTILSQPSQPFIQCRETGYD